MAHCPQGHESADTDFCDVCGRQLTGATAPAVAPVASPAAEQAAAESCPVCGEPRTGRFCEGCSYDFAAGPAPGAAGWVAVIGADRAHYERTLAEGEAEEPIPFPDGLADRSIPLLGNEIRIGRRSRSAGWEPEIDLSGAPQDPGVSHRHAVLLAGPDGGWLVRDTGSTNGTTVNDDPDPIEAEVALADGDRIHLGAWTTITFRSIRPNPEGAP